MSFRIEQKLYVRKENLLNFKEFLNKNVQKGFMNLGLLKACILITINLMLIENP